jgi:hypothetical protein
MESKNTKKGLFEKPKKRKKRQALPEVRAYVYRQHTSLSSLPLKCPLCGFTLAVVLALELLTPRQTASAG